MWNPLSWVMEAAAIMAIALAHGGRDIRGKVLHNGKWMEEDAAVLVPGDIISIKLADIVPADAHLLEGDALKIDQQEEITSPDPPLPEPEKCTVHSFCKILIASDSSTHGGFSVLRRHADECLPPLDMSQQPPWQELVDTNLHGNEWHFRHNFRGNEHIIVQVYSNKLEISTFPLIETQFHIVN